MSMTGRQSPSSFKQMTALSTALTPLLNPTLFKQIFEQSADAKLLLLDGKQVIDCNAACVQLFGYAETADLLACGSPAQLSPAYQPCGQSSRTQAAEVIRQTLVSGSHCFEWVHQRADGTPFWTEVTLMRIAYASASGESTAIFQAVIRDIRDRKAAEMELQQSKAFLEAQRESSLDGILVVDADRHISAFNQQFLDLWRVPDELRHGQDDHQMMGFVVGAVADSEAFLAQVLHLYTHVTESSHDETLLTDGRLVERNSVPVTGPTGEHWGRIWYFRDITDRRQSEAQLQHNNRQLQLALDDLQSAQLQIVQSEKMSALGNLVAGVAHEINNPVGFISGNLTEAQRSLSDVLAHLDLYRSGAAAPEIADHAEEIDLDYQLDDLPKMIDSMKVGCDRIKSISTSLRTFSRADTDHKVTCNLHDGIDSTILILKHRLKAEAHRPAIQVVTDYADLPKVECFPGQLNQVFMNILANAVDVFDEATATQTYSQIEAQPQIITIQTAVLDQQVQIRIRDNGPGMPDSVKQRIFDHLFTTKAVGQGTGLGLSIVRQIVVEKHGGSIEVDSTIGVGTEFVIQLPIAA
jgi:PAS domain S-box-containing protein